MCTCVGYIYFTSIYMSISICKSIPTLAKKKTWQ